MGSQGFEPRSWDVSCLSTPIVHHNRIYCSVTRISSKTTGVPDDARLHYNPKTIFKITKPRERFELPCNWSAANRLASKLSWQVTIILN